MQCVSGFSPGPTSLMLMLLFQLEVLFKCQAFLYVSSKAYCGFKSHDCHSEPDIATGKWGCGAFKGDPQLKGKLCTCILPYLVSTDPKALCTKFSPLPIHAHIHIAEMAS